MPPPQFFDVRVDRDLRPMFSKDCLAIRVDFAESNGLESSPSSGKSEASDSAEQVEVGWLLIHSLPLAQIQWAVLLGLMILPFRSNQRA